MPTATRGPRGVGTGVSGNAAFVAIRNCLFLWFEGVREISNFGCVAISLFFAPLFEVGWIREERRAVRVTRTTPLYHTPTGDAIEFAAGKQIGNGPNGNVKNRILCQGPKDRHLQDQSQHQEKSTVG